MAPFKWARKRVSNEFIWHDSLNIQCDIYFVHLETVSPLNHCGVKSTVFGWVLRSLSLAPCPIHHNTKNNALNAIAELHLNLNRKRKELSPAPVSLSSYASYGEREREREPAIAVLPADAHRFHKFNLWTGTANCHKSWKQYKTRPVQPLSTGTAGYCIG